MRRYGTTGLDSGESLAWLEIPVIGEMSKDEKDFDDPCEVDGAPPPAPRLTPHHEPHLVHERGTTNLGHKLCPCSGKQEQPWDGVMTPH